MKEDEEGIMSPPKKRKKDSPNDSVSFDMFKKLIQNLPDICVEVQRDGVAKTLDECALWYYESFYTDPQVRQKYPYKLRACPMKIRDNLLWMPESETEGGVKVQLTRMGTFIFPVSFSTFKTCVNVKKVLGLIVMTKEERRALLADEKQCHVILKKFYNSFYMFPDRRSTNIFGNTSPSLLSQLLEPGKPLDEMAIKSLEKIKSDMERPPIVRFEVFKEHLANIYDIAWQLKLHDRQYVSMGFEKCARALYLAFYLTPEIRDKYAFKWRPCSEDMLKRLLTIPNEEAAEVLRRNMSELDAKDKQTLGIDDDTSTSERDEPRSAPEKEENRDKNPKVAGSPEGDLGEPPKEHVMSSEYISRLFLEDSFPDSEEEPFQTDIEVDVGSLGRFMHPVSFDTFRRCINYLEIIRPVLQLVTQTESELAALVAHPFSPLCEKTFRRYYCFFFVLPEVRHRYPYRFSCSDPQVLERLTEYAKPLDGRAIRTLKEATSWSKEATIRSKEATTRSKEAINAVSAPQSKNESAKEDEMVKAQFTVVDQECEYSDNLEMEKLNDKEIKENEKQPKKTALFPVTFHIFKGYVKNLNEILQQMKLCDEYTKKSDAECAEEYYEGFYTSPEIRKRFLCKFRPCPARMRDLLLSYAQKPQLEDSSQESDLDVEYISDVEVDICNNILERGSVQAEESKYVVDEKKTPVYPVSFQLFRGSVANLKEIVSQMLECDDHEGKSEEECAQDYYKGFYASQEMRDRFPYQLKPCPAKMRKMLISFPATEGGEHLTEKDNQNFCNSPEKHAEESAEKIEENIEITEVDNVETSPSETPGNTKQSTPQNQTTLNAQQPSASLNQGSSIRYKYPVPFTTFQRFVNYNELKVDLAKDIVLRYKQPEKLTEILGNEMSCLRLLRHYYKCFYTNKECRSMFKYNFNAAPPELANKLLEMAKPVCDGPELKPQSQRKPGEDAVAPGPPQPPIALNVFLKAMHLEDVVRGMQQEPEYSTMNEDECKLLYYNAFYSEPSIRDRYPYKLKPCPAGLRDKLLMIPPQSQLDNLSHHSHSSANLQIRKAEHAGDPMISINSDTAILEDSPESMSKSKGPSWLIQAETSARLIEEVLKEREPEKSPDPVSVPDEIPKKTFVESEEENSETDVMPIEASSDMSSDSQSCPSTQLNTSNVDVHSQVPDAPHDPLAFQTEKLPLIKQEPIKFLDNLRGTCTSDDCQWEQITLEEQIVNLSEGVGSSLACFAIPKPSCQLKNLSQ